jgi:hypothetical protein
MNLFGRAKKAAPKKDPLDEIHDLNEQLENLQKTIKKQQASSAVHRKNAIQYGKIPNKKREAQRELSRYKQVMDSVSTMEGQYDNLYKIKVTIESALRTTQVVKTMERQVTELKGYQKELDPDKVADTMDDLEESMAHIEEAANVLARGSGPVMDEDDLTNELALLEQEQEAMAAWEGAAPLPSVVPADAAQAHVFNAMPSVPAAMPSAPVAMPTAASAEEAAQLADLEAEMA